MDNNIKDILLELEDEGYDILYHDKYHIRVKNNKRIRIKDVKDVLLRLFYYKNQENVYFDIITENRIMGARLYNNEDQRLVYRVDVDASFFDGLYIERSRGNNNYNPLYIKNSMEIKEFEITIL